VRATGAVKTANLCLVFSVPPVVALVIFGTYASAVGPLTPAMAFVVLSLFNTLRFPLVVLPKALRGVSGARAAGGAGPRQGAACWPAAWLVLSGPPEGAGRCTVRPPRLVSHTPPPTPTAPRVHRNPPPLLQRPSRRCTASRASCCGLSPTRRRPQTATAPAS
jgi:hypothetical protein